jgi:spore coat polysaccharide biosynthesis predicted glycosyltransferase SpsG
VVVSLGGGPRARVACEIAGEIARRAPEVQVRVVGGFVSPRPSKAIGCTPRNVVWVGPSTNLARELGRALVAVVGGGVSLYEACALGTPAVAVAVVPGQRPTVGGFAARGAALGRPRRRIVPRRVAEDALALLGQKRLRHIIARRARRLIDGQGAHRAAHAITRLVEGS